MTLSFADAAAPDDDDDDDDDDRPPDDMDWSTVNTLSKLSLWAAASFLLMSSNRWTTSFVSMASSRCRSLSA